MPWWWWFDFNSPEKNLVARFWRGKRLCRARIPHMKMQNAPSVLKKLHCGSDGVETPRHPPQEGGGSLGIGSREAWRVSSCRD